MTRTKIAKGWWLEREPDGGCRVVDQEGYALARWRQLLGDPTPAAKQVVRSQLELRGEAPSRWTRPRAPHQGR